MNIWNKYAYKYVDLIYVSCGFVSNDPWPIKKSNPLDILRALDVR